MLNNDCQFDENMLFWIWRSAVAPSDATEKYRNMDAQLQSLRCTLALKIFWKIYLFVSSHFNYPYELWQLLPALYSDVRKKNYIYTQATNYRTNALKDWCAKIKHEGTPADGDRTLTFCN